MSNRAEPEENCRYIDVLILNQGSVQINKIESVNKFSLETTPNVKKKDAPDSAEGCLSMSSSSFSPSQQSRSSTGGLIWSLSVCGYRLGLALLSSYIWSSAEPGPRLPLVRAYGPPIGWRL